ncbi:membrane protein insertase YidC [Nocardioides guangzhouensis]|uniref:Membrane protein insertase YidC n=1 Tax=Nocardioides guangzhouensis TaxID=2497878 RepID=A0A4V1XZV0_9ACTN|nr:membrane protein insertase YidC [Nocardioides guangzhouensis]RYP88019.1 membrane protein insertase YidC [Nocardioides guangzhouensis]
MSPLDPLSHALAAVMAAAHHTSTALGADPDSGATWALCIAAVVVVVRLAMLPLAVRGVRLAHATARARPHLRELTDRYRERRDPDSVRELMAERRRIADEHRMSRLGCLPLLLQMPIWFALYQLVGDVAAGSPVGAMDSPLVASLGTAGLLGVPLAERGYLGAGPAHLAVVAGLAGTAALLSFLTQRYLVAPNSVLDGAPEAMVRAQQLLPVLSAAGLVAAGGVVPVALLVYWVCSQVWTLGHSAVVWRWFPTPGSPAAARRQAQSEW